MIARAITSVPNRIASAVERLTKSYRLGEVAYVVTVLIGISVAFVLVLPFMGAAAYWVGKAVYWAGIPVIDYWDFVYKVLTLSD